MVREDVTENAMFELRPEERQGRRYVGIWEKRVSGGGKSVCKDPEVGVCLRYLPCQCVWSGMGGRGKEE